MKITKIERQKKNTERYSLYVDDVFWMGVHEKVLIQFGLYKAQPVTKEVLEDISRAEYLQAIYVKAIHFLSYGLKTVHEMREYLKKYLVERAKEEIREMNEFDDLFIDETIRKLMDQQYLNDLIYSQSYIRTQANLSQKGPQLIKRELVKKGVNDYTIEEAMREYPDQLKMENAQSLIDKYYRIKQHQYPQKKLREKLREMLNQKGFERDLIEALISEMNFGEDEANENDLLEKEANKQLRKWQRKYDGYALKQKMIESLMRKGFNYRDIQIWIEDNEEAFFKE